MAMTCQALVSFLGLDGRLHCTLRFSALGQDLQIRVQRPRIVRRWEEDFLLGLRDLESKWLGAEYDLLKRTCSTVAPQHESGIPRKRAAFAAVRVESVLHRCCTF